jgi:DHA2 family multidrug resistance protein
MSIVGVPTVLGPILGPVLGGLIVSNFSWRWIFYINVPITIVSLYMTHRFVEDPPYLRDEQAKKKGVSIDYVGFSLVALGVGCLQMVLDKGQDADWFASHWITATLALAVIALVAWVIWEWRHPNPIVELKLLKMWNFSAALFFMFILGMVLYGTTVLIPEFLQLQMGYPAVVAGEAMAGGGLIMMIAMPTSGFLTGKMDPRKLMACGFAATALGLYNMATHLTLGMDFRTVFMMRVYQVAGLAFVFIPSNVLCYVGVPREKNNQIASMTNFIRNIGGSIGIALTSTLLVRATQARQNYLVGNLQNGNLKYHQTVEGLAALLHSKGLSTVQAAHQAYGRVDFLLMQQAATAAYKDVMALLAIVIACLIPLAFIMRRPRSGRVEPPPAH